MELKWEYETPELEVLRLPWAKILTESSGDIELPDEEFPEEDDPSDTTEDETDLIPWE